MDRNIDLKGRDKQLIWEKKMEKMAQSPRLFRARPNNGYTKSLDWNL